ncbi:hypothetical protein [Streptomyces sp. NPDC093109]|uniref:hypothetical protein n=1 Tax=Streptomyces sp. NPDC093109 TaxID=3154977 RepID=UPI00344E4015
MSYDRRHVPALGPGLRLLPWENETGKPCFLSTSDPESMLSRLADDVEADQLDDGADVLSGAKAVLDDRKAGEHSLRLALRATTHVLGDVLRIADSRGGRLPVPSDDGDLSGGGQDDGDLSVSPAESHE